MTPGRRTHFDASWQALLNPGGATEFFSGRAKTGLSLQSSGFSIADAWLFSEVSRLIYRRGRREGLTAFRGPTREQLLQRVGLRERCFFYHPNVQAALIETRADAATPFAVLVFRGTTGRLDNWLINADVWPVRWPYGGRVHRGFKNLLNDIWPDIEEELTDVDRPIYYTGHSLGAALATLVAAIRPPDALYTFGSPRVGNDRFAEALADTRIYRIYHEADVVTGLPPRHPFGYGHVGRPYPLPPISGYPPTVGSLAGRSIQTLRRKLDSAPAWLYSHAPVNYSIALHP